MEKIYTLIFVYCGCNTEIPVHMYFTSLASAKKHLKKIKECMKNGIDTPYGFVNLVLFNAKYNNNSNDNKCLEYCDFKIVCYEITK